MTGKEFSAIVEMATQRMAALNRIIDETPPPDPAFLGLSHAKLRRTVAQLRAGKLSTRSDSTPEQLADAIERTIHYEKTVYWVRAELFNIATEFCDAFHALESRVNEQALEVFHEAKRLAELPGARPQLVESVAVMKRAWREASPRVKSRRRGSQ